MTEYFLGVDGGQTSTTALIGDKDGTVIGSGRGGPINHVGAADGKAKFVNAIENCVTEACQQAGVSRSAIRFRSSCFGFSGGPADKADILKGLLTSERTIVTHDALIALTGATDGEPGLITIAGTGSIAFGRGASGEAVRAGGWGYLFGDEGGGFYITRQALRAALRFEEGWGSPTSLRPALLDATGSKNVNELLHRFYTSEFPRPRVAGFAKLVDQEAESGDQTARDILAEAGQQLAGIASAVHDQLFDDGDPVRVAYIGGVFRSSIVLATFRRIVEAVEGNQVRPPVHGPAAGALLESYRAAGISCKLSNVPEEKQ